MLEEWGVLCPFGAVMPSRCRLRGESGSPVLEHSGGGAVYRMVPRDLHELQGMRGWCHIALIVVLRAHDGPRGGSMLSLASCESPPPRY